MKGWHFCRADRRLGYGDGRLIESGKTLTVDVEPRLCAAGLHASKTAIDALQYASGLTVCYVELSGVIKTGEDKACATERHTYWIADSTEVVLEWARWCAQRHLGKWDPPEEVVLFLNREKASEGKGAISAQAVTKTAEAAEAAEAAARAVGAAARSAAEAAAGAAGDAAWAAVEAARAAWAAARAAAGAAAWSAWAEEAAEFEALNAELERRLMELAP